MSDSDDSDFAFYGTPLEPLEEDEIPRKKPITLEEQVVTDKQGRRRFHGAFTGGFSAGFYNTVGSLEGWKPSNFKSSRESKAEQRVQRPEDFMDEEDTDEFGIAPTVLRARPEYRGGDKSTRKRPTFHEGPIPGEPVLKSVIGPVHDTIGVQLLMKMGWKPGQGVGPRLTKLEKKKNREQRAMEKYGSVAHGRKGRGESSTEDEEEEGDLDTSVLFAPDDYEVYIVTPKTDKFGLGYQGLADTVLTSHLNLFDSSEGLKMVDKQKKVSIKGQAFGVGAFETEDFDIYAKDDMSQYDFALETSSQIAERKRKEREARKIKEKAYLTDCDVIEGFVPAKGPREVTEHYPPPKLPDNFQPIHRAKPTRFDVPPPLPQTKELGWKKHFITATDRAATLGEPSTATLHEEVLSKAKDITSKLPEITEGAFKPFISDPDKQKRYEKYLQLLKIGAKDALSSLQPISMTDWEKEREKSEFDQAAKLYKPLSGMMAERFAPAALADDLNDPLAPVKKLSTAVPEMEAAAKAKMFGKLTKVVKDWAPVTLLCKRFNIPEPNSTKESLEKGADKWTKNRNFSVFDMLEASQENTFIKKSEPEKEIIRVEDIAEEGPSEPDKPQEEVVAPINRPPSPPPSSTPVSIPPQLAKELGFKDPPDKKDLFKAIFLSSSEDEDEEEVPPMKTASSTNVLRNTSPPRGIFANLDLDALNTAHQPKPKKPEEDKPVPSIPSSSKEGKKEKPKEKAEESVEMDPLMYGPKLPQPSSSHKIKFIPRALSVSDSSDSESDTWVEKPTEKEKKHKKHSKKHKKEKKKSKSKHKDKKKKKR